MRIDRQHLVESDIRDRFHRFCCPAHSPAGRSVFRQPIRFCFISFERAPGSDFTITFGDFYITHPITCQRFFDVKITFFSRLAFEIDETTSRLHSLLTSGCPSGIRSSFSLESVRERAGENWW